MTLLYPDDSYENDYDDDYYSDEDEELDEWWEDN